MQFSRMMAYAVPALLGSLGSVSFAEKMQVNPLAQVLTLLDDLTGKITKDGEAEAVAYHKYSEWCEETAANTGFAIKTAEKQQMKLEAKLGELASDLAAGQVKIEELAGAIATGEADLKSATEVREKEVADFAASEAELVDSADTLSRAIGILEKEMAKNPAAFAQIDSTNVNKALQAMSQVLDAAAFPSVDRTKLMAFVQARQGDEADDLDMSAPAAATYKTHSTGILDVLEDLKEKAVNQLSDLRKAEVNARHNFEMLKQSLEDQLGQDSKDKQQEAAQKASNEEAQAAAKGDLEKTVKSLAGSKQQLATAHSTCLQVAADHEATVAARKEELSTIAKAKKVLVETTSGAEGQTYSLLQLRTVSKLAGSEVVAAVKRLAKQQHSSALAQLASRISSVLRYSNSVGDDPFGKVKGLIQNMIAKLESEAGAEATEKAYCDEQLAKTAAKKAELEDDVARQTSRIDRAAARSAQLKEEIKTLEAELAALAKEQAEMDGIRQETHADFVAAKADLELGLSGVRKALDTLRNYYSAGSAMLQEDSMAQQPAVPETHTKSMGAGGGIIDILEVVESDFATNLAKEETVEDDAQSDYEKTSQSNAVTKTIKEQDVKYKTQEAKSMATTVAEYSADRETTSSELAAVNDYNSKIKARCIAKPETYAARSARRAAEIQGLKQALSILQDETALFQRKGRRGHFRGSLEAL